MANMYEIQLEKLEREGDLLKSHYKSLASNLNSTDAVTEEKMTLFNYRHHLKELILTLGSTYISKGEEKMFLEQYRDFFEKTRVSFPKFLFDDYNYKKFKQCINLIGEGYTLIEIEDFYNESLLNNVGKIR